jgi:rhodanese-related sulfurtransferase
MALGEPSAGYAGDLNPREAWDLLSRDPEARLVDVRTAAEWSFVGTPDLAPIGRKAHCLEWQSFPAMTPNPNFAAEARAALGENKDAAVLFLCRSGGRSRAAAIAMTAAGYTRCFNIAGGFEGDLDPERRRGKQSGWKAANLPWKQT